MSDNRFEDFEKKASEVDPFEPQHSTLGWGIITGLFLLACVLWIFAGPNYIKQFVLPESDQGTAQESERELENFSGEKGDGSIPGRKPGELAIVFMNVKYGDGILVQAPDNTTSLIDGGEGSNPEEEGVPAYDLAYELYLPLFKKLGISQLEHLVATTPSSHHMGAHADIVAHDDVSVQNIHRTGYPASFYDFRRLGLEARDKGITTNNMDVGEQIDFGPGVKSQVLFGNDGAKFPPPSSHVLYLKYGDVRFLLMSDLPSENEKELVLEWADSMSADVLKVGTHGSRDSTSMELLQYVQPGYAVISVSRRNPLGAPHDEVLERLKKSGVEEQRVFRTDVGGNIAFFTDGQTIRVQPGVLKNGR